jgi:hypothetical protein
MRRISAQIEQLSGGRFMLLVGLVAGAIQGVPRFFLDESAGPHPQVISFIVIGLLAVLWWTAAFFLWWIAVHRRRWSLWATAAQVTLGLALADVLNNALGMVVASVETHGTFAEAIVHQPLTVISSNLFPLVVRSPLWFLGAMVAVALGRHLNSADQPLGASASTPAQGEAIS